MDKLVDEVLEHIFKFLPNDDVIAASEVCERWHSIISSSSVIMRKIVLKIDDKAAEPEDEKFLNLPYRNLRIENYYSSAKRMKEIVKQFLTDYSETMILIKPIDFFVDFLPMMSNLTELSLWKEGAYGTRNRDFKVDFPNLKSLILFDASSFIDHIRSHQIETLKVREDRNFRNGNWMKFFGTCERLKVLSLDNFARDINLCDYGFKLSSLVILGHRFHNVFLSRIFALFRAQKDSLKKISLGVDLPEDLDISSFMIYDMKLEELDWYYNNNHRMNYVMPKENSTIKKLILKTRYGFSEDLFDVLKSLQAVEHFDFTFRSQTYTVQTYTELLRFLHYHMPKMRTLTLRNPILSSDHPTVLIEESELKANQVETLIIYGLPPSVGERKNFYTCAPNIKKLIIKDSRYYSIGDLTSEEFKMILKSLTQLEEFEFRGTIEVDDEVLELISHSNVRRITFVYHHSSQLAQAIEVCEKLKTASTRLVVMRWLATREKQFDEKERGIVGVFEL